MHSALVGPSGACECGVVWPQLADDVGTVPCFLSDREGAVDTWQRALRLLHTSEPPTVTEDLAILDLLATWGPAHWGRFAQPPLPSADSSWLHGWLDVELPPGPILVLGCGPGADLLALGRPDRDVVAMDASPALVALARYLTAPGTRHLPHHRDALRHATRPLHLPQTARDRLRSVTWVVGDALDPPLAAESFAAVVALNLLDAVPEPLILLGQCEALLRPGGVLLTASPYHFQVHVTPGARQLLRWLPDDLSLPEGMERLCTGRILPDFLETLVVERRAIDLPWQVPVHPGFTADYRLHAMRLRKVR